MNEFLEVELLKILEENCTGSDDHDGCGARPGTPLLERCGKCREMFEKIQALVFKVPFFSFPTDSKAVRICPGPGCTFGIGGVVHGAECKLKANA